MRAMLFRLETDPIFANEIIDLIFSVPEEEVVEEDVHDKLDTIAVGATVKLADLKAGTVVFDAEGHPIVVE